MDKEFTFKLFSADSIDEMNNTVNYYFTRNNVSMDKFAVDKVQFMSRKEHEYKCILPLFEGENKVGRPVRVHFMEGDSVDEVSDKMNFYIRRKSLSCHHINDYHVEVSGNSVLGFIFYTVPETKTNR